MASKLSADEGFMTTEEVLEYLQVNLRTVYRLIKNKNIPAIRVGRQWRFRRRDIDAWLESQRAGQKPELESPERPGGRRRVLLVDDEPSSLDLLTKMLATHYAIVSATDAAGALDMVRGNPAAYDVLISDLNMPGMDGLELIREVRHVSSRLPIIIVTGYSTESSAIQAVNLGVAGYLVKPFKANEVLAVIARALSATTA